MVFNTHMIHFSDIYQKVGHLTPIEAGRDIPFSIKRLYYITRVPTGITRGFHSHKALEQVLVCLHGSVKVRVKTPYEEEVVTLGDAATGLYIGHMVWREMFDFSPDAVLLVLASEHYTEEDYIRDYAVYEREALTVLPPPHTGASPAP